MNTATPPPWAESLLRAVLAPSEFETLAGDLLEEYRESRHALLGARRADGWYVRQVFGFVVRTSMTWGVLLGVAMVARDALDWFLPPPDFHTRAAASTYFAMSVLLMAGFRASWRSGSWPAGGIAGVVTAGIAAFISLIGAAGLLAVWHDPRTLAAIAASGGLSEAFTLPLFAFVPGMLLGTVGGSLAAAGRSLHPV
jgi:hypothetical protein